jgi:hypothetical protein
MCAWGHGHHGGGKGTESALISVISVAVAVAIPDTNAEPEPEPNSICHPCLLPHLLGGSLPCQVAHCVVDHVIIIICIIIANGD